MEVHFAKIKDKLPTAQKTGTTTAGEAYKDGMASGGDTRALKGMIAVDKNCQKYTSYLLTVTAVVLGQLWASPSVLWFLRNGCLWLDKEIYLEINTHSPKLEEMPSLLN